MRNNSGGEDFLDKFSSFSLQATGLRTRVLTTYYKTANLQIESKRDRATENEVTEWIEAIIEEKFDPEKNYEENLKDGVILCKWVLRHSRWNK